jgi:hypothetical protein
VRVEDWLAEGQALTVSGAREALGGLSATVDLNSENGACVAAARAEFSARKTQLKAAGDFTQEGGLNFEKWVGRKLKVSKRVDLQSIYPFEWIAAWHASNWAEANFTSSAQSVLMMTDPAQLDPLIENLTALGDGMLDELAYARPIGPMPEGYDPRDLAAVEGFLTGFAVKFDYEGVLARKWKQPVTLCIVDEPKPRHAVECTLTTDDMRSLAKGGTKRVAEQLAIDVGAIHQVDASRIEGYADLAERFNRYEKELQAGLRAEDRSDDHTAHTRASAHPTRNWSRGADGPGASGPRVPAGLSGHHTPPG